MSQTVLITGTGRPNAATASSDTPPDPYAHAETLRCLFESRRHGKEGPVFINHTGEAYPW